MITPRRRFLYRSYLKPAIDRLGAAFALLLVLPVLIVVAVAVRVKFGSPVLFTQVRPGKGGLPFRIYKFRTMIDACDSSGHILPDELRLSPFGRLLRSTSLDELPELWNVVRGDMSLVGPRPLLTEYLDLYSPRQARRHEVVPGLTGLAQVSGRNQLPWKTKFALDVWYVDHCSFVTDVLILLKTVFKVLAQEGINTQGHATAPRFGRKPRARNTGREVGPVRTSDTRRSGCSLTLG
jgi:sugar transferase EpsL